MTVERYEALIYSNREENSNKYYIIEQVGTGSTAYLNVKYGRLGRNPTVKRYDNVNLYHKKIEEKLRKGYSKCYLEDIISSDGNFE